MTGNREPATQRLASYLEARADELDLDWRDVAEEAGISVETLRAIRRGNNLPSRGTRRGLDRALRWELGSVTAILAGDEPTPVTAKRKPRVGDDFAERIERILADPEAMRRAAEILRAARIGDAEEEEQKERRHRDAG